MEGKFVLLLLIFATFLYSTCAAVTPNLTNLANNNLTQLADNSLFTAWRPTFHFAAPNSWMNDPCGPLYDPARQTYHLYYQVQPGYIGWGNISWGHAKSSNMIMWEDVTSWEGDDYIAIAPGVGNNQSVLGVFTGATLPITITGDTTNGTIIAIYTSVKYLPFSWNGPYPTGAETQSLAVSYDGGVTFQEYAKNPIIGSPPNGMNVTGWRDPKFQQWPEMDMALYGSDQKNYYLTVSSGTRGVGPRLLLYQAPPTDLTNWTYLFPLVAVFGNYTLNGNWSGSLGYNFEVSNAFSLLEMAADGGDNQTVHTFATLGTEGGNTLLHQSSHWSVWVKGDIIKLGGGLNATLNITASGVSDWGDTYALNSFYDPVGNRRIFYGWVPESNNGYGQRAVGYNGQITLPRQVFVQVYRNVVNVSALLSQQGPWTLIPNANGTYTYKTLGVRPITEVTMLRQNTTAAGPMSQTFTQATTFTSLNINSSNFELMANIDITSNATAGFVFRRSSNGMEYTSLIYDPVSEYLILNRTYSSLIDEFDSSTVYAKHGLLTTQVDANTIKKESLSLRIFLDDSLLEVYANNRTVMATHIYPALSDSLGLGYTVGGQSGTATFSNVFVWSNLPNAFPMRPANTSIPLAPDTTSTPNVPDLTNLSNNNLTQLADNSIFTTWRPTFHFASPNSWLNDPCGPLYDPARQTYHLYYQAQPGHIGWGNISWGHAKSSNMIMWEDVTSWEGDDYVAIAPGVGNNQSVLGVFTGATLPITITGNATNGTIIAIYTSVKYLPFSWNGPYPTGAETQSLAVSYDGGVTFQEYAKNPIIGSPPNGMNVTGWRDPKFQQWPEMDTALYGSDQKNYYLTISSGTRGVGPRLLLYQAPPTDLTNWTYLFPLVAVLGNYTLNGNWSGSLGYNFEVSNAFSLLEMAADGGDNQTVHTFATLGTEGGNTLLHQSSHWSVWVKGDIIKLGSGLNATLNITASGVSDWGDTYALNSFYDPVGNRRIFYGWVPESNNGYGQRAVGYNGQITLPRQVFVQVYRNVVNVSALLSQQGPWTLIPNANGTYTYKTLGVRPITEVTMLRQNTTAAGPMSQTFTQATTFTSLNINSSNFELMANIDITSNATAGFVFRRSSNGMEYTSLIYDPVSEYLILNRTYSSLIDEFDSSTVYAKHGLLTTQVDANTIKKESLSLRIFLDNSLLEVYANNRTVMATHIYPALSDSLGLGYTVGGQSGTATFSNVYVWANLPNAFPMRPANTSIALASDATSVPATTSITVTATSAASMTTATSSASMTTATSSASMTTATSSASMTTATSSASMATATSSTSMMAAKSSTGMMTTTGSTSMTTATGSSFSYSSRSFFFYLSVFLSFFACYIY